jgi:hypothetical protein
MATDPKPSLSPSLEEAIREFASGDYVMEREVTKLVLQAIAEGSAPPIPADVALHLTCLPANLREVKRGLENGMFGPSVVEMRGEHAQRWVNACMAMTTIDTAVSAVEYLQQIVTPTQEPKR